MLAFDQSQKNHNGGWIGFSPRPGDKGNLYIASGDGGGMGDDKAPVTLNRAAMLRIRRRCWQDAPHSHQQPASRDLLHPERQSFRRLGTDKQEIWQFGLRNPYRATVSIA